MNNSTLTITRRDHDRKTARQVEYDCRSVPRIVKLGIYRNEELWTVIWLFYAHGQRVATVILSFRFEANRTGLMSGESDYTIDPLRTYWPERIEMSKSGDSSFISPVRLWLTDGTQSKEFPLEDVLGRHATLYLHPEDSERFGNGCMIMNEDKNWIMVQDREAELAASELAPDMLTIKEAAVYANVDERTIRDWVSRSNGDKPMLPGVIKTGRMIRIPRTALDPWKKPKKARRAKRKPQVTLRKRRQRNAVKRKR